ncbi:capsular polyglutamate synthetase PgsA [soil metagenome]
MKLFRFSFTIRTFAAVLLIALSSACQKLPEANKVQTKEEISESKVVFLAVGDIMISRGVAKAIDRAGSSLAPFEKMADVFRSTDFNFANLESPISGRDNIVGKGLVFNMRTRDIEGLKKYNFKVLNLANNHAMDQLIGGLRFTGKTLDENNLTHIGTGDNLDQAWEGKTITVKGVKIGFVGASYASINDGGVARNDYVARMEDTERLKKSIEKLRAEGADFIVATMHGGIEYTRRPNKTQTDFAHAAIDYGADIVIGAHPHWAQIFEKYKDKYIFYSLGNFIFDQTWSRDTQEGLALKITLDSKKSNIQGNSKTQVGQIELMPVVLENASTPRLGNEAATAQILNKIGATDKIFK